MNDLGLFCLILLSISYIFIILYGAYLLICVKKYIREDQIKRFSYIEKNETEINITQIEYYKQINKEVIN